MRWFGDFGFRREEVEVEGGRRIDADNGGCGQWWCG